jgi:putative Mn2+ efflux pump MntP
VAGLLTLLLIALSVGLGNFAASIAIGTQGINKSVRIRVAVVFGLFETGMPIIGLLLGQQVANKLGSRANLIAGGLLVLAGLYLVYSSLNKTDAIEVKKASSKNSWSLLIAGLSLSVDNLIVGFSLGTRHQPLLLAIAVIGLTSIALALAGLELGRLLSNKVEEYSEILSGIILLLVGVAIAFRLL